MKCPYCGKEQLQRTSKSDGNLEEFGIPQANSTDATISITKFLPLNVYICKNCGYVALFQVKPKTQADQK